MPRPRNSPTAPRIGLVGPRRVHQGLGPFLATHFTAAGARIVGFAVSREPSLEIAADELARRLGHRPRGYVGAAALLAGERLDALVIASPVDAHAEALAAAQRADVAVFCEKPLLAPTPGSGQRAQAIVDDFLARDRTLFLNTQWPQTLPTFFELYPDLRHEPLEDFWMLLSPASVGPQSLADAMPHAWSLLEKLAPGGELANEVVRLRAETADITFTWQRRDAPPTHCRVELRRKAEQPRPAAYAINGRRVDRRIEMPGYRFRFDAANEPRAERSLPVADPLVQHVAEFVSLLHPGVRPRIAIFAASHARMLERLVSTVRPSREGKGHEPEHE